MTRLAALVSNSIWTNQTSGNPSLLERRDIVAIVVDFTVRRFALHGKSEGTLVSLESLIQTRGAFERLAKRLLHRVALGIECRSVLENRDRPRVLVLGDSIPANIVQSIGSWVDVIPEAPGQ